MSVPVSLSPEAVLRNYFHAKDENRPILLQSVFTEQAVLEVQNNAAAINFPARTVGREAIADVLVRTFGQTYENIYSFYLAQPAGELTSFKCGWLVVMTEKLSRNVRVGCGHYEWEFCPQPPRFAQRLVVHIATMLVLDPAATKAIYEAISPLTYPWSTQAAVLAATEGLPELALAVQQGLSAGERDA